jgi:hypothetical protein
VERQRLRNPLYFALAMALPGAVAIFSVALPESSTWDRSGWIAFAVAIPTYVALCLLGAFVSFLVPALLLRRFASIAKQPLLLGGLLAGCVYLLVAYAVNPLWSERYFLVTWSVLAFASSLYILLRWGQTRWLTSRSTRTLLGGPAARPSSRRLAVLTRQWYHFPHDRLVYLSCR